MRTGIFIIEIDKEGKIKIPPEIKDRLNLIEGDKVEVLLKKIRSKRLEVTIGKNSLYKIMQLSENKG